MDVRVGCNIDISEIVFDLFENLAFTVAKRPSDVRMDSERSVSHVVELLGKPPRLAKFSDIKALRKDLKL